MLWNSSKKVAETTRKELKRTVLSKAEPKRLQPSIAQQRRRIPESSLDKREYARLQVREGVTRKFDTLSKGVCLLYEEANHLQHAIHLTNC